MKVLVIIVALLATAVCIGIGQNATRFASDLHGTVARRNV
jgi:hypothetical protein